MKSSRLGSVLRFAPLLASVLAPSLPAADIPPPGGVEKEAVQAGVYRAPADPPEAAPAAAELPLAFLPAYNVVEPGTTLSDGLYYQLKAGMSWYASGPASLIFEEFAYGPQIRAFERPQLGKIDIPWSPMVTEEPLLSPSYPNFVSDRLQVRFPLVNVVW